MDSSLHSPVFFFFFFFSQIFDYSSIPVMWKGQYVNLTFFDTAGGSDYDRLRPLSYPETDVFLVCFSVASPDSFESVVRQWYPELAHLAPEIPVVLVGLKSDLRDDAITQARLAAEGLAYVDPAAAVERAREIGAVCYMECSSLTSVGLSTLIDEVIRVALLHQQPAASSKKKCIIL